jgi:hypothetical protein
MASAASTSHASLATFHGIIHTQRHGLLGLSSLAASTSAIALDSTPSIIQIVFAGLDVLVDPFGNLEEGSLDTFSWFGTRLDVAHHTLSSAPVFGFFLGDCAPVVALLVREIALIADKDDDDVLVGDLAEIIQPSGGGLEGGATRDVED